MNSHFSKEDIQIVKKLMKRRLTLLIIREMQSKTTMRHHFIPIRMAIKKKKEKYNVGEDLERLEHLCIDGGTVKWYSHCGKQYGGSFKNLKIKLPCNPEIPGS